MYFQYLILIIVNMEMEISWKKKGRKSSLTLYRRSQQFHVKNKHDTVAQNYHDNYGHGNMPTTSKPTLQTTCGVQTTSSMAKLAIASVQTKSKSTTSLSCQTDSKSKKSAGTQYTKPKYKRHELQKEFLDEKFLDSLCQFLSRTGQLRDFMHLTKGLVDKTVDQNNIAWQAVLHLG